MKLGIKIFLAAFVLIVMSCFVVVFVYTLFLLTSKGDIEVEEKETSYQYLSYDPSTNEASTGIVTMPGKRSFQEEEQPFLRYEDDDGHQVLISDFGITEYVCTGSCSCGTEDQRRASTFFSLGITAIVASASTFMAMSYAKQYFEDNCQQQLNNEMACDEDNIQSEVEKCLHVAEHPDDDTENWDHRTYWCQGNCIPNIYGENEKPEYELAEYLHNDAKEYGCEKLQFETDIQIDNAIRDEAAKVFMVQHLKYFCLENSLADVEEYTCLDTQPDQCEFVRPPASKENVEVCTHEIDQESSRESKSRESGGLDEGRCDNLRADRNKKPMCTGFLDGMFAQKGKHPHNPTVVCRPRVVE